MIQIPTIWVIMLFVVGIAILEAILYFTTKNNHLKKEVQLKDAIKVTKDIRKEVAQKVEKTLKQEKETDAKVLAICNASRQDAKETAAKIAKTANPESVKSFLKSEGFKVEEIFPE